MIGAELAAAQRRPTLVEAARALQRGDLATAERLLKARLREDGDDFAALRMLAELAARLDRLPDAQDLVERALAIAPAFAAARLNYATVLHRRNRLEDALAQLDILLASDPRDPAAQAIKAAVLAKAGDYDDAIALYHGILARFPDQSRLWMSLGHALKTVGRQADCVAAYRRVLAIEPGLGEAWWSLANLKTVRFDPEDETRMRDALAGASKPVDLYHLHYALGKALEDRRDYAGSFTHYAAGAALRKREVPYSAAQTTRHLDASRRLLTAQAFAARQGQGLNDPAAIFIVGLPRAGSTLIEQILASHSLVEGTMELPEIGAIARDLAPDRSGVDDGAGYLTRLLAARPDALAEMGRRYIDRVHIQRKTDRPYFIDKMPNNFGHIGLIHLILPNAKIIDARRDPMASCFSAFKQHFSRGQSFTYALDDLGHYYRDYVSLMDHYDAVLPGRVHRVLHEHLVADPEAEIRCLIAHCGLDFEQGCINFHKTERPVRTASSEQVRQPITSAGVDHWRNYEAWLEPLKCALGDTIARHSG